MKKNKLPIVIVATIVVIVAAFAIPLNKTQNSDTVNTNLKAALGSIRMKGEIYYAAHSNSYNTDGMTAGVNCASPETLFVDATIKPILESIAVNAENGPFCSSLESGKSWAVSATLRGGAGDWCVDSNGGSKPGVAAGGVCI